MLQVAQSPPLFVKSSLEVTRVASPDCRLTIVVLVILVNVNDVVAGEMRVCEVRGVVEVSEERVAVVLAVCRADGLVTTACVVCTRVHCDGVAD